MIYVYIKNGGIIKKSKDIVNGLSYDSVEQLNYELTDKLIYENGKVVKYDESVQYKKDNGILGVEEERDRLRERLNKKEKEYEMLENDYLKLRLQYDLLSKKYIPG